MIYFLITALILIILILLLKIRLKVEISPENKTIFLGLGRTGLVFDFSQTQFAFSLANRKIKTFTSGAKKKKATAKKAKEEKKKTPSKRDRNWRDFPRLLPAILKALGSFFLRLIKGTQLERFEGEIEAGFDQPHLTGQTYGYYQAALAACPSTVSRLRYQPDWSGASFSGSFQIAIALPLYSFLGNLVRLLWQLPLREILKITIGKKKGASDGKQ